MKLYTLLAGRSKKRMKPIMTDELHKVQNYMKAREKSGCEELWHEIVPAETGAEIFKKVNPGTRYWKSYNKDRSRDGIPRVCK